MFQLYCHFLNLIWHSCHFHYSLLIEQIDHKLLMFQLYCCLQYSLYQYHICHSLLLKHNDHELLMFQLYHHLQYLLYWLQHHLVIAVVLSVLTAVSLQQEYIILSALTYSSYFLNRRTVALFQQQLRYLQSLTVHNQTVLTDHQQSSFCLLNMWP